MTAQTIQLYLDRLQADDLLRHARRILLPVTLSPATLEADNTRFQRRGVPMDIEAFLDHFRREDDPNGPLVRHNSAVVIAPLGGGKSTMLQALTWEAAQRALGDASAPVPFYLPLARLGDTGEAMLMNALWHVGLPISRMALREALDESSRSLFFLIDPSPAFATNGAAEALDNLIGELEQAWPGCRWLLVVRPDTALALPEAWQERRFYLLDPLPATVSLTNLLHDLAPAVQGTLERLVATVPGLATLIQRPAIAESLRGIVEQFKGEDGHRWLTELLFSLLNRVGGVETPRAKVLETLHALALQDSEGPVSAPEATRLVGKSLPQLHEAGVLDGLLAGDGANAMQHYRFADPALRKFVLWLADPEAYTLPDVKQEAEPEAAPAQPVQRPTPVNPGPTREPARVTQTTAQLVSAWEQAASANDLDQLVEVQRQLNHLQAETLHQIGVSYREAARLSDAATQVRMALEHQPDNHRFRVTLGTIQAMGGQHDEARRTLEMALPHAPSGLGYFYLGRAYEAQGWTTEAFQAFQQAATMESPEQAQAAASAAAIAPNRETMIRLWEQALALQPGRADWHVQLGRLKEEAGDHAGAQVCYQHALEAHPNEAEAHHNLGLLLLNQEQNELALQHLRRASVAQPKEANWLVDLGQALEATHDGKGAEEAYRRALRLEPRASRPFAALGSLLRREERYDEAYASLKQSLALDGEQVEVLFEMGLLCEVKADMAQALSAFRRAAQLAPASPGIRSQLGAVHRKMGQHEEARQWLQEALELNPRYGPAYDELGQLAEGEERWDEAARLYRMALDQMPENVGLRFRTATMMMRLGRFAEATPLLEEVTQAMPESAEAHWHLADALREQGRNAEALTAYRTTARLDGNRFSYALALAQHARGMQRLDEAQRTLDHAIELDGSRVEAYQLAGELALDRREASKALVAFQRAIELAPHDAKLYQQVSGIYRSQGRPDEAIQSLSQAVELVGESAPLLAEMGTLHEEKGDLPTAINFLDRALKAEPQALSARLHRARLLFGLGQNERARRDWETILRVNPASSEAHYGLGQLLLHEEKRPQALAQFERAVVGQDVPAEWLLAHGQLAGEMDRSDEGIASLRRILEREGKGMPGEHIAEAYHSLAKLLPGREALKHAERAIALSPARAPYYVTVASIQQGMGLSEQALESLETAHSFDPQNPDILTALAAHHERRGNMWDASDCYRRAAHHSTHPAPLLLKVAQLQRELMSDWREARTTLREATTLEPNYAPAHRDLGILLVEAGQRDEAEPYLRRALALDTNDTETILKLGEVLVAQGKDAEATPLLRRGVDLSPQDDRIQFLLGKVAMKAKHVDGALLAWNQAATLAPQNATYQRHLGTALAEMGRLSEARTAWERALELNDSDAESYFLIGKSAMQQHDAQRAVSAFRDAVTREPTRADFRRELGETWLAMGQWDSALSALRGARELDDNDARTHYGMAQSYEGIGRIDHALERAVAASTLDAENPTYSRMVGDLRARQEDWAGAAAAYRQALLRQPEDASLFMSLGRAERQTGAVDRAAGWFRKAVELEPQSAGAHHLLAQTLSDVQRRDFLAELAHAEFFDSKSREATLQEALEAARRASALEGRNPSFQLTLAQLLVMNGESEAALAALRQTPEPTEHRAQFLTLAGIATMQRGDAPRARGMLDQATRLEPDDASIWLALASAAETSGDLPGALAAAERAQALASDDPLYHYALGRLAAQTGDFPRARREVEAAIAANPDVPGWHRRLGDLFTEEENFTEALTAYDEALQRLPKPGRDAETQTEEAVTRFARGRALVKVGQLTDAIVEMETAIGLLPGEHEWHSELAAHLMEMGRYIEAQNWLRSALGQAPDRPEYALQLARAQAANDEASAACETLRAACGKWSDYAPAWLLLGQLLVEQGEVEAGQEVLAEALALSPDDAGVHVAIGDVLRRQGLIDEANQHFETALLLDPMNADAHIQKGRMLMREGEADAAMEEYHTALRLNPDHLQAHYYLGRACQHMGHLNKAMVHFRYLTERTPYSHWAWASLAECCEKSNDLEMAYDYYAKANEVAQGRHFYYLPMGRLLKNLKRYNEAIPVLRQAVKTEPQNTDAYKMLTAVSAIVILGGRP